jgi:hypothetical protein
MSERKVNLSKILKKQYNFNRDEDGNETYYQWEILIAMKEACRHTLKLASENARTIHHTNGKDYTIDKQSITNTINQVE